MKAIPDPPSKSRVTVQKGVQISCYDCKRYYVTDGTEQFTKVHNRLLGKCPKGHTLDISSKHAKK